MNINLENSLDTAIARCGELVAELDRLRAQNQALRELLQRAENILGILPCEECEHSLVLHFDHYGCEYERGDVQVQDVGAVAQGPCSCKADGLSEDGNDQFLLLRDIRQVRFTS